MEGGRREIERAKCTCAAQATLSKAFCWAVSANQDVRRRASEQAGPAASQGRAEGEWRRRGEAGGGQWVRGAELSRAST